LVVSLAAAGAGLLARGLAVAIQAVWLGGWPPPDRWPALRLVERRRARWIPLNDRYATLVLARGRDPEPAPEAGAIGVARNRIALAEPSRATWMGDRIAAVDVRVYSQYHLDLVTVWPRLWLLLPDAVRTELRAAHGRFQDATGTAAWGLMYTVVGLWWWPAALLGTVLAVVAWRRGRVATGGLADLIEATVDLFHRDLGAALGVPPESTDPGDEMTRRLSKGA